MYCLPAWVYAGATGVPASERKATHRSNTGGAAGALKACYGQLYLLVAVESWLG